jgi:hypothetical protein
LYFNKFVNVYYLLSVKAVFILQAVAFKKILVFTLDVVLALQKFVDFAKKSNAATDPIESRLILQQLLLRIQERGSTLEQIFNGWIGESDRRISLKNKLREIFIYDDSSGGENLDELFLEIVDKLFDFFDLVSMLSNFFPSLLTTRPNKLECLYLAITFQSSLTFAGNTRSLPKKGASERCSNWVGSCLALKF